MNTKRASCVVLDLSGMIAAARARADPPRNMVERGGCGPTP